MDGLRRSGGRIDAQSHLVPNARGALYNRPRLNLKAYCQSLCPVLYSKGFVSGYSIQPAGGRLEDRPLQGAQAEPGTFFT